MPALPYAQCCERKTSEREQEADADGKRLRIIISRLRETAADKTVAAAEGRHEDQGQANDARDPAVTAGKSAQTRLQTLRSAHDGTHGSIPAIRRPDHPGRRVSPQPCEWLEAGCFRRPR